MKRNPLTLTLSPNKGRGDAKSKSLSPLGREDESQKDVRA